MSQAEDDLSKPLLAQLRRTTTSPIFVHPIKWSKLHLAILRVRGLDKDYPVERVIGRDHLLGSSNSIEDKDLADILRQVSVHDFLREVNEDSLSEGFECSLLGVSGVWFKKIYEAKGYSKHLHRWRPRSVTKRSVSFFLLWISRKFDHHKFENTIILADHHHPSNAPDRVFNFRFGNEKPQRLLCEFCIHNWHDENEYPASFPLVAVLGRSQDYYKPRLTPYVRFSDFERWQRKRKTDDRDVEEVALLIALAQKQAEVLKASRFAEDDVVSRSDERLHVFHVSLVKYRVILMLLEFILLLLSRSLLHEIC